MKKIFTFVFLIAFPALAAAQNRFSVYYDVGGHWNHSRLDTSVAGMELAGKGAVHTGLAVQYELTVNIAVETGLYVNNLGAELHYHHPQVWRSLGHAPGDNVSCVHVYRDYAMIPLRGRYIYYVDDRGIFVAPHAGINLLLGGAVNRHRYYGLQGISASFDKVPAKNMMTMEVGLTVGWKTPRFEVSVMGLGSFRPGKTVDLQVDRYDARVQASARQWGLMLRLGYLFDPWK